MAEQDLEYIIKEQQFKQYQGSKAQIKRLTEQLQKYKLDDIQKGEAIKQYAKQIAIKSQEVVFFQLLIEQIGQKNTHENKNQLIEIESTINQSVWEVIDQSELYNKKTTEQEINAQKQKFYQRFEKSLVKVEEINTRLESQEEMISQLNQSIVGNNKLLIGKTYNDLLKQLEKDCQTKLENVEALKAIINESRKTKQERQRLELRVKEKEDEVNKYRDNVQKLSPLVTHYYKKIQELQAQNKNILSQIPQGDKAFQIKFLIDKHVSEIEAKLKNTTGISDKQVFEKINEELLSLTSYISKAIESKAK